MLIPILPDEFFYRPEIKDHVVVSEYINNPFKSIESYSGDTKRMDNLMDVLTNSPLSELYHDTIDSNVATKTTVRENCSGYVIQGPGINFGVKIVENRKSTSFQRKEYHSPEKLEKIANS